MSTHPFSPKPPAILTVEEMRELVHLISWSVDGPEQGVCTAARHREIEQELIKFLNDRGYYPFGQWTLK